MAIALVRQSDGKVETFLREDGAVNWAPPEGFALVPEAELPEGWQRVEPEPQPAPQPDYLTFWDATLTSAVYQALYAYANVNLPTNTALTAFIAAFQDAKEGRANPAAIQQCIFLIMGAAQSVLTAEHLGELQALLVAHHMSSVYTLVVPE